MQTGEFKVSFLKRAAVDLADNEKVSLWEPARAGTVRLEKDTIRLDGKWRVSAIGNFLGGGILGELLIKPFFLKERSEGISVRNLERVVIHQKKKTVTFHLFQTREQGMVEVHVFVADKNVMPQVTEALKAVVPANLLQEQSAG
jgi:DNA-binding transcriptional ArsR family regulator